MILGINGMEFGGYIAEGSISQSNREIGDNVRSYAGITRKSRLSVKRDISFETIPMTLADAYAWECLILGEGHHWDFEYATRKLYSSKGLGPYAASGAACINGAGMTENAGYLYIPETTGFLAYLVAMRGYTGWTVALWRSNIPGGLPSDSSHYVVNSLGYKWIDGVRNDATVTTFLTATTSTLTLSTPTGQTGKWDFDELTWVPYVMPTAWPPLLYAANAAPAFGNTPALNISGSLVGSPDTRVRSMIGSAVTSKELKCKVDGSFQAARVLSVTLEEI